MTDSELRKEAERVLKYFDEVPMRKDFKPKYLFADLRAVHDAAYAIGFDAAIEKAATTADKLVNDDHDCMAVPDEIRALKLGGGK